MSDRDVKLSLRIHDECNGSDVFGSDICTCRPYLIFGVEEAVKEAQAGGSGVVIYFRKEGRALGEVTKYLVYNARKSNALLVYSTVPRLTTFLAGKRGSDRTYMYPICNLWIITMIRCKRIFPENREYRGCQGISGLDVLWQITHQQ